MKNPEKILVIDTETTNGFDDPLCYDVGWSVVDLSGKVYEIASFVVSEIFLDPELMSQAYFSEKASMYWDDILAGRRKLASFEIIRKALMETKKTYYISKVCAHNARFDYRSLTCTLRFLTSSKRRYFFTRKTEIWDSLKMARQTFGKDPDYIDFCFENGFVTPKTHQAQLTAEVLYRYLTGSMFTESHTGTEDTMIEKEILIECLKRDPKIECRLWVD